jgi:hypothetical protein
MKKQWFKGAHVTPYNVVGPKKETLSPKPVDYLDPKFYEKC